MKKSVLLFALITAFITSYSQDFLVKHNGDTIRGDIKFSGKTISLLNADGSNTSFSADEIAYIKTSRYIGTVLHCKLVLYSDNIDVVQKWDYTGGKIRDTVMILNSIFKTKKMNLYEAFDKDQVAYYFVKKPTDSLPIQMIVTFGIQSSEEKLFRRNEPVLSMLIQQRRYIDQLTLMMLDCKKVTRADLEMMDYRSYSFKKIIRRYNRCK